MQRRIRLWLTVIVIAILAATGVVLASQWLSAHDRAPSDCDVVRTMTQYNKSQSQLLAKAFNPADGQEPGVDDYRKWADQLTAYSSQIHSPAIAKDAHNLAEEAHELVDLVTQARSDNSGPADPEAPPPWAKTYADLASRFHGSLTELNQACTNQ